MLSPLRFHLLAKTLNSMCPILLESLCLLHVLVERERRKGIAKRAMLAACVTHSNGLPSCVLTFVLKSLLHVPQPPASAAAGTATTRNSPFLYSVPPTLPRRRLAEAQAWKPLLLIPQAIPRLPLLPPRNLTRALPLFANRPASNCMSKKGKWSEGRREGGRGRSAAATKRGMYKE